MKKNRLIGSLLFVLGLFTIIFVGIPWFVTTNVDVIKPWWFKAAIFCILGGILLVLLMVVLEQKKSRTMIEALPLAESQHGVLLLNSAEIPGLEITEILGLVKGHTIFAIWLGNDLSALLGLVLGGELTAYTEMMGQARKVATDRMITHSVELEADAIINVRYMITSVVGSAAELLVYGTVVKLSK